MAIVWTLLRKSTALLRIISRRPNRYMSSNSDHRPALTVKPFYVTSFILQNDSTTTTTSQHIERI
jgi:hypothetical protein